MRDRTGIVVFLALVAAPWALLALIHWSDNRNKIDLGISREPSRQFSPLQRDSSSGIGFETSTDTSGDAKTGRRADVLFNAHDSKFRGGPASTPGTSPGVGTLYSALEPLGDVSALVPTPKGLYLMTVDLWDEEEFRAYLAKEECLDYLPTLDDCRRALQDEDALAILIDALSQERVLVQLEGIPTMTPDGERSLVVMRERWKATCRKLMERLDLVSGYAYWSVVAERYEGWVAE